MSYNNIFNLGFLFNLMLKYFWKQEFLVFWSAPYLEHFFNWTDVAQKAWCIANGSILK